MTVARMAYSIAAGSTVREAVVEESVPLDIALVGRMALGDKRAMEAFYPRWEGVVREALFRKESDVVREEDILAEVFWHAWCAASRFDTARGSVRTWLLMLTRTTCVQRCRFAPGGDDRSGPR